jgi:TIR domain/Sel1 repeat
LQREGEEYPALGVQGKIFISYRREDAPGDARGICDRLGRSFGASNVFMDVDQLVAGQRFERELDSALAQCDVLIAVIGSRWMELLAAHTQQGKRDYVREEIAAALHRDMVVVPVMTGREANIPPLPAAEDLPDDIRDLVLYQKQSIAHETFRRDADDLVAALKTVLRRKYGSWSWRPVAAGLAVCLLVLGAAFGYWGLTPSPSNSEVPKADHSEPSRTPSTIGGPGDHGPPSKASNEAPKTPAPADQPGTVKGETNTAADDAAGKPPAQQKTVATADPSADCDRLAASPYDKDRPKGVTGVLDIETIDPSAGPACDDAMRRHPDVSRYIYESGRVAVARRETERAAGLFDAAIAKGNVSANAALGVLYLNGEGVTRDYDRARRLFETGAEGGDSHAMAELGNLYFSARDFDAARSWYEKAAAQQNTNGLARLGVMYANGLGVAQDTGKALELLGQAAALRGRYAMYYLGLMYEEGIGVASDPNQSREWYQKALNAGYRPAREKLNHLR